MKVVGMFREFAPGDADGWPSIVDHLDGQPLSDVDQIVGYLDAGYVLFDMLDTAKDVLGDEWIINGASVLTDGEWLWRKDLSYYLTRHHVRLPEAFLAYVRDNGYRVPEHDVATLRRYTEQARSLLYV